MPSRRLYTDLPVSGATVTQFGFGPAGRQLTTSIDNDPDGDANKLDEYVFFKIHVDVATKFELRVAPAGDDIAMFVRVNDGTHKTDTPVTSFNSEAFGKTAIAPISLQPGDYTVAVTTRALVDGVQRPAAGEFSIRLFPIGS
jgi:hypothetical protein